MSATAGPLTVGTAGPLTIGTAGHVDHGKTALVRALTGVDTDRLPEERARGLTIVLGYAPLTLPSGRKISVIDVPGHERFVRTMVAGASGVDAFLMVIAADDGVMPQTIEHAKVLRALGIERGVIAISKADLADPDSAAQQAARLLPGCPVVACSARSGDGLDVLRSALDDLVSGLPSRASGQAAAVRLHVDRSFTVAGRGAVITGTLWSGEIGVGETLELACSAGGRRRVRVRGVEVHDRHLERAAAGQRVAVNLVGVRAAEAGRGDVLVASGLGAETKILDCALELDGGRHGERVQVHHGTRAVTGRLCVLDRASGLWQLRLERPLLALDGDRLVVRRLAPPDTLGGGCVLDAVAARHGARPEICARLRSLREGHALPPSTQPGEPPSTEPGVPPRATAARATAGVRSASVAEEELGELEQRLLDAGPQMLSEAQMEDRRAALAVLRGQGRAVRVSGRLYAHADVLARVRAEITELLAAQGPTGLAGVRDALGISRKASQAFLEHLDAERVTRRLPDDTRVLAHRSEAFRQ